MISFGYQNSEITEVKLTPIEIKARTGKMGDKARLEAINQTVAFSKFLSELVTRGKNSVIWQIAWRGLISEILQYGFRVYGQLDAFVGNKQWEDIQRALMELLGSNDLEVNISSEGRLILVDDNSSSKHTDKGANGLSRTVILSKKDAFELLVGKASGLIELVESGLGSWGLGAHSLLAEETSEESPEEMSEGTPEESTEET